MKEDLIKRMEELDELEKQAWANLNFILGAKSEIQAILTKIEGDTPNKAPKTKIGKLERTP